MNDNYKRVAATEANDCSNLDNRKIGKKIEELVDLLGKDSVLILGYATFEKVQSPGVVVFHGKYRLLPEVMIMINKELAREIDQYKNLD